MINKALFASQSVDWRTPEGIRQQLDHEFSFTLDPCPIGGADGLTTSWGGQRVFCNPPYGRRMAEWFTKAREADLAVYLLPARTCTAWWHEWAMKADEIRFIRGRLDFGGRHKNAPFPSVLVIFRGLVT